MSYSISGKGATKAAALEALAVAFEAIVVNQPVHAADREMALKQAEVVTAFVVEPVDGQEVYVSLSGSLGWHEEGRFINASVNVYAHVQAKAS